MAPVQAHGARGARAVSERGQECLGDRRGVQRPDGGMDEQAQAGSPVRAFLLEELTGRDLASARDRIEFWLALRGRELVS